MSIINFSTDNPTQAQILQNQSTSLKAEMSRQFNSTYNLFLKMVYFVWNNDNFTAQQVFDSFGPDAVELCLIAASCQAMLEVLGNPIQVVPTGFSVQPNPDGTVTVIGS